MSATSLSLLEHLQHSANESAWERLVDLYTPLIRVWLKRYALMDQDIDDLVQEVLAIVVRKIPEFKRKPQTGAFRRWLRTITVNCLRGFCAHSDFAPRDRATRGSARFSINWKTSTVRQQALGPGTRRACRRRLLEMIRPRFEAKTWAAFQRVAIDGTPVDQVAKELGMTVNAVFIAKSRVVHLLRQEGKGLLD